MNPADAKHVFISYVQEDAEGVAELCEVLTAAKLPYWRDRNSLGPGDAWKEKIRDAIRNDALVFLCCFSENSQRKSKSYMNEEIHLAIEEYRKLAPGETWFIPVRLDAVPIPEWQLSAGRMLSDINYVDFFGDSKVTAAAQLTQRLGELMNVSTPDPTQVQASLQEMSAAERADEITRLTKELLPNPQKQIELDDIVCAEVHRLLKVLDDPESAEQYKQLPHGSDERTRFLVKRAIYLAQEAAPFCNSLKVAASWGEPGKLEPWSRGVRNLVAKANELRYVYADLDHLLHIPAVLAIMTCSVTAVTKKKWANLRELVVVQTIPGHDRRAPEPILEISTPYAIAEGNLAREILRSQDIPASLSEALDRRDANYTPQSGWVHRILHPYFADILPTQADYDSTFDQAEVMLGLLSTDAIIAARGPAGQQSSSTDSTQWLGRAMWRVKRHFPDPIVTFAKELNSQNDSWPPLRAGLFGGEVKRAERAIEEYNELFRGISHNWWL